MKKFFLMAAAILMFGTISAADQTDKLWLTDYDQAVKTAKETKRPILMLFTGSDWCPYCVKLEKNVLSKTEFKKYAKDNLVLLYLDFPRRKYISGKQKAHNQQLRDKYDISGYPTAVLIDAEGKQLGKPFHGTKTAEGYIKLIEHNLGK